jgi:hypothetical protein
MNRRIAITICLIASLFLVFSVCAEGQIDSGKGIGPDRTPQGQIGKENPEQGIGPDGTPPGQGGENPGKGKKGEPPGLNKEGANAKSSAEANVNIGDNTVNSETNVSVKESVQGVAPQLPWQLWQAPAPEEKFFWNKLGAAPEELVGEWSKERASSLVDSAKIWFVRGFLIFQGPMKVQSSFDGKYPKSDRLTLMIDKPKNAKLIDGVGVSGKDILALICLGRAIEEALANGATMVRLEQGMNTNHKADSAGLGGTHVHSSEDASSTGLLSLGSAGLKKEGEPAVILVCYR